MKKSDTHFAVETAIDLSKSPGTYGDLFRQLGKEHRRAIRKWPEQVRIRTR